jgi:ketol-acid reductoisomerase
MRKILDEIQDGSFARRWIEEGRRGMPEFRRMRAENAKARIEPVGAELRSHMAFIGAKTPPAGWADAPKTDETAEPEREMAEVAG